MSSPIEGSGILAGIAGPMMPRARTEAIERMRAALRHREKAPAPLAAHAEIALCAAPRPGPFHVAFDGHLYNRSELAKIISPPSDSDTAESWIAELYHRQGDNFPLALDGSFAIALYDSQQRHLFLLRDRVGEKPLYWTVQGSRLLFASELKALLRSGEILPILRPDAISAYLKLGFLPQEMTPLKGVYKLLPGHVLRRTQEGQVTILPYWSYSAELHHSHREPAPADWEDLARNALRRRLIPGTPTASLLREEGEGLDLLSLWAELAPRQPLPIYSPLFRTNPTAQSPLPVSFHGFLEEESSVLRDLPQIVYQMDEPNADPSAPLLWHMGNALRRDGIQQALMSTGSLQWLIAHTQQPQVNFHHLLLSFDHHCKRHVTLPLARLLFSRWTFPLLRSLHTHPWHHAFIRQHQLFDDETFSALGSSLLTPYDLELLIHQFPGLKQLDAEWSALLYLNLRVELPNRYSLLEDRLIASQGVTPLTPYLDYHLIHYLSTVANKMFPRPTQTTFFQKFKSSLWKPSALAPQPSLPPFLAMPGIQHAYEALSSGFLAESGIIDPSYITEALTRRTPITLHRLWTLLVLEVWLLLFFDELSPHPSLSLPELLQSRASIAK